MSFWTSSTTQQRLAQIDGAISVGMTMRQTAMNLGTTKSAIQYFANSHGRYFSGYSAHQRDAQAEVAKTYNHLGRMTQQRRAGTAEIDLVGSFEIFPSRAKTAEFLEKREYD